jgi:hypothetical protein
MRAAVRPLLVFASLFALTSASQSDPAPGGGVNSLAFNKSSPTPTKGGVDVSAMQKPTVGYTCTKITIRIIDNATGDTLDTYVENNPGAVVTKSFTGLGANREVQVIVDAIFSSGNLFDPKRIEAVATTQ